MLDVEKFETILAFSKKKDTNNKRFLEEKINSDRYSSKNATISSLFLKILELL